MRTTGHSVRNKDEENLAWKVDLLGVCVQLFTVMTRLLSSSVVVSCVERDLFVLLQKVVV